MLLSDHFKRSLKIISTVSVLLIGAYFWLKHRIHDIIVPPQMNLPRNDKELISFDENKHIITVTTPKGTVQKYSRNPDVEIHKDGSIKVDSNAYGFEVRPFLGFGYSQTGRLYTGVDLLYIHQFDFGASFGWTADNRYNIFQPMLSVGYNFWSNTSLNLGVNPVPFLLNEKPELGVFVSVRL